MKSVSNMVRDVYSLLNIPEVKSQITGEVWEDRMHSKASSLINIVVKGVTLTNTAIQLGLVHIDICTPNIELMYDNVLDPAFPDKLTLNRVSEFIMPLLDYIYEPSFHLYVEAPANILEGADGNWYSRITINYQSVQDNYRNI